MICLIFSYADDGFFFCSNCTSNCAWMISKSIGKFWLFYTFKNPSDFEHDLVSLFILDVQNERLTLTHILLVISQ